MGSVLSRIRSGQRGQRVVPEAVLDEEVGHALPQLRDGAIRDVGAAQGQAAQALQVGG